MYKVTKGNLSLVVDVVLEWAELSHADCPDLALHILQSEAIELSGDYQPPLGATMHMIVVGMKSRQGTRTSGQQVNAFALAGVLISATSARLDLPTIPTLLLGLLAACMVTLSPEQAAFFLAIQRAKKDGIAPYAAAIAKRMGGFLNIPAYSIASTLEVVTGLQLLGVDVSVEPGVGQAIHHTEARLFLPGF